MFAACFHCMSWPSMQTACFQWTIRLWWTFATRLITQIKCGWLRKQSQKKKKSRRWWTKAPSSPRQAQKKKKKSPLTKWIISWLTFLVTSLGNADELTCIDWMCYFIGLFVHSSMRFEGVLNVDLNEITMNLVPFPDLHFLLSSIAPLYSLSDSNLQPRRLDQMFKDIYHPDF